MRKLKIVVPLSSIGWKGGDNYVESLTKVLQELETFGKIKLVDYSRIANRVAKFKFIFGSRGCEILSHQIYGHSGINLPWPIVSRKMSYIFWVPDVQDLDIPQNFELEEVERRHAERRRVIQNQGKFYFSSKVMETRFLSRYKDAASLGIVRFTSNLDPQNSSGLELGLDCDCLTSRGYVYAPNQWWVHKNHINLIKGYIAYREQGGEKHLVLTGPQVDSRKPDLEGEILKMIQSTPFEIHNFGVTSRETQLALFQNCGYVAQVSNYEGWSTTVEEALKLQKQILLSDIPVHREQLDGERGAIFCDVTDHQAIATGFTEMDDHVFEGGRDYTLRQDRFRDDLYAVLISHKKSRGFFGKYFY